MARTFLPRTLGAAGIVAALVAALTLLAGSGLAAGSAAQANYAPANTAAPTISGTPQVGSDAHREQRHLDERHDADVHVPVAELRRAGQQLRIDLRRNGVDVHRGERAISRRRSASS